MGAPIPPTVGYRVPPVAPRLTVHTPNGRCVRRPHAAPWHVGAAVYRCPMTISDEVPGGIPSSSIAAMKAGLATMGLPDLDVVVTDDFVATVQERVFRHECGSPHGFELGFLLLRQRFWAGAAGLWFVPVLRRFLNGSRQFG
jgi:hypothetical protein